MYADYKTSQAYGETLKEQNTTDSMNSWYMILQSAKWFRRRIYL